MRVTRKGQVTIPPAIRDSLGLQPNTEVEFELAGDYATIRKARSPVGAIRREKFALDALRGSADVRMTTDQILALTRGDGRRTLRKANGRRES